MKGILSIAAALSLAVGDVSAHYIFQQLTVAGTKFPVYQHIRKNTNYNSPVTSLSSPDLRCNEGGLNGGTTSIVDIKAGDSFTFSLDTVRHGGPKWKGKRLDCRKTNTDHQPWQPVYHQGPISM